MDKEAYLQTISAYVESYVGHESTRHMSEHFYAAPPVGAAIEARKAMAHTTRVMLADFQDFYAANPDIVDFKNVFPDYQALVRQIPLGSEVEPSVQIADYLVAGQARSYEAITTRIRANYAGDSIAVSYLDLVEKYIEQFAVTPPTAARLALELIAADFSSLARVATTSAKLFHSEEAVEMRFCLQRLVSCFDSQVAKTQAYLTTGAGIERAQALSLNAAEESSTAGASVVEIFASDATAFVDAYHLQDKPYTEQENKALQELLQSDSAFLHSLIAFQLFYVKYCQHYLEAHPERMRDQKTLEPFSPIFIPCVLEPGAVLLAPNPKLLKTMINNWGAAIVRSLAAQASAELLPLNITSGVLTAKQLELFRVQIGLFSRSANPERVLWQGLIPRVCPAEQVFTAAGAEILPQIYARLCG